MFPHSETVVMAGSCALLSIVHICSSMYENVHRLISLFFGLFFVSTKPFLKETCATQIAGGLLEQIKE